MHRPSWDAYFLGLARAAATRSGCMRRQVGAVLVRNKHVLSTGYNGPPRGAPPRDESTCVRIGLRSGERGDVVCCVHAEVNAVAQAAYHGISSADATLYTTVSPCAACARLLVNAGIARVVYADAYGDPVGAEVLAESGVMLERGDETEREADVQKATPPRG